MIRQAVILCAGKGTRLGDITEDTPKPLVEVDGRPFLEYSIEKLRSTGIYDIVTTIHPALIGIKYNSNIITHHITPGLNDLISQKSINKFIKYYKCIINKKKINKILCYKLLEEAINSLDKKAIKYIYYIDEIIINESAIDPLSIHVNYCSVNMKHTLIYYVSKTPTWKIIYNNIKPKHSTLIGIINKKKWKYYFPK